MGISQFGIDTCQKCAALCVFAAAFSILGSTSSFAQSSAPPGGDLKRLTLAELGDIEVTTASKEPETLRRTPAAVHVLTSEDIQRSGATSLPEVLRLVPGIQVSRIDSDHWAVGVRGFANQFSQSLLVMIDGRSLYTPLFAGVYWSVQDIPFDDIERIEVIRGPGGTIWGANAVNGVINIITKRASDTPGVRASVGGGSLDHANASVRYGGHRGTTLDYRFYAKAFDRGASYHPTGPDFDTWRTVQGGFRADWALGQGSLTVQGDVYKGRHGQSISIGSFSPPSQTTVYDPMNVSGGNLLAHWRRPLAHLGDVQVQTYYDRTYLLGPQIGESRNTFDADFIHQLPTVRRQRLLWGLGARVSPSHITQTIPTLDVTPHDQTASVLSAFGQDEITLVPSRAWLTVGAKVERNDYTGVEVQPSMRLLWTPTRTQSVWTAVTRAVRTPSRLEENIQLSGLLAATPPTFVRVTGNPNFVSEELTGYEAGYRVSPTSQFMVEVSTFHNKHDNLQSLGALSQLVELLPPPAHVLVAFPYANGVEGTSNGIEIAPDWQPMPAWRLTGSYSYLRINMRNEPGNGDTSAVATYNGSSPRHQALVRSAIALSNGWEFDQTIRYVSALPAQKVKAYATPDLRIGWNVTDRIALAVVGQNLAQAHHAEFGHAPPPAVELVRTIYATLTWSR